MTVRILLGKISAEWKRTLVELAQTDSDLEIVGTAENSIDILLQARELQADVVVLARPPGGKEPGLCSHLILEYPNLAVLILPGNRKCDVLRRMVLRKESWGEVSKEVLRAALKA
jgi:DNA-binding NarL/FixJ family response regulator